MSYAIPYHSDEPVVYVDSAPELHFIARSRLQWLPLLLPLALTGASWAAGGAPALTDLGFLFFTIWAGIAVTLEFFYFPRRFGIGGLLLWGGILVWFCQDYFTHWWGINFNEIAGRMSPYVVAKAAFLHVLFVMFMSIGLGIQRGQWAVKLLTMVPDPEDDRFWVSLVLAITLFGMTPYFFFSAEAWYLCMWHAATACWTELPKYTVSRTGNLNYNWGGYIAQIMQVGEVGGLAAMVYAILIAKTIPQRALGTLIWMYYVLMSFQGGSRGDFIFNLIPPIGVLFIRFQANVAAAFKKFSIWPFLVCGVLVLITNIGVQIQADFRSTSLSRADLSKIELTQNKGNTMFSEGLLGYSMIPDLHPFFYDSAFPGEGAMLAIPKAAFDFVVGIIPRALWHNKPVDGLWEWYNHEYQGTGREGTTISKGLVGSWYFKYGPVGMIEGAVLVGWLMGVSERALQNSNGKPMHILFALAFATWLFRTYRDFIFIDLYGLVLGGITLYFLVIALRPIFGTQPARQS